MIIDTAKPIIETGGETTYEESFAIGNIGRIMGILRNSMYANPIKAIVREIASNARDAHREVGKDDKPIEIHLPNDIDEHFYIKDYGPGISPERMSNVFIRYGSSTKNDDNCQTGGFGLGAKTPFAYTDQFQITTITPSDVGNVKRIYIAYIDESETGKMRLMAQSPTNEETGTEISLVVKEDDFSKFKNATLEVCRYWAPLPTLKGRAIPKWPTETREIFLHSDGWTLFKKANICNRYSYSYDNDNNISSIIVDGIYYPINPKNIDNCSDDVLRLLNTGIEIIANTGDVILSANREELQYDIKTQGFLINTVNDIFSFVQESLVKNIQQNTSYRDAVIFLDEFKLNFGFAIPDSFVPEWNGNKVVNPIIRIDGHKEYSVYNFFIYKNRRYQPTLSKKETSSIRIGTDTAVIFNDLNTNGISRSRIQYLIDSKNYKDVYVVSFPDLDNIDSSLNSLKTKIGIDPNLLEPIKMSSIVAPRKVSTRRGGRGSGRANYKAFVFDKVYSAYRQCDHFWRPTELDLENGEGVYVVSSGRSNEISSQSLKLTPHIIEVALNYVNDSDVCVHAIREKDIEKLGDGWIPFKLWIESNIEDDLNEKNITAKDVVNAHAEMNSHNGLNYKSPQEFFAVLNSHLSKAIYRDKMSINSSMVKYFDYINGLEKKFIDKKLNEILLFLGHDSDDIETLPLCVLKNNIEEKYPLLNSLNKWAHINTDHVLQYIMLVDAECDRKQALDKSSGDDYPMVVNG